MSSCGTKYLGVVEYDPSTVIDFPEGLPAFEDRKRFILIERPDLKPLVFMQSVETSDLCFLTVPAGLVVDSYRIELSEDDNVLALPKRPAASPEILCLAMVSLQETGPTVNLLAPLVIDLRTLRAMQPVMPNSSYSHQHPLTSFRRRSDAPEVGLDVRNSCLQEVETC